MSRPRKRRRPQRQTPPPAAELELREQAEALRARFPAVTQLLAEKRVAYAASRHLGA
ncbi:MAG TPA: hypothetical protein VD906_00760 [Caulobacteraceae bacterium]|nr:hypothetical protein [Caulobacteraceae bacterium]